MTTEHDAARAQLSEMTEITEQMIERTFHRYPDLETLYRDCPSAFWLAPDADDLLPIPAPAPAKTSPAPVEIETVPGDSPMVDGLSSGVARALIVAGPIFAATGLMLAETAPDERWWSPFGRALASLVAAPLTITVGAMLALLPVLAGVLALGWAGKTFTGLRQRSAWSATGALMGVAIAAMFNAGGAVALALVTTSIACATVARSCVAWTDPEFA